METRTADHDSECFFIAPIGDGGTEERRRSDAILNHVVAPAVEPLGLTPVRADKVARPGQITYQVIEHVLQSKGAVADLHGANPNVYYELAIRHTAHLPVVLIAETGDVLPFDIANMRTIFFDHHDLTSAAEARDQITDQMRQALAGSIGSPVAASVNLQDLERGDAVERTLAELVSQVAELARNVINTNRTLGRLLQHRDRLALSAEGGEQLDFTAAAEERLVRSAEGRALDFLAAAAAEARPLPKDALAKLWLAESIRGSSSEELRETLTQLHRQAVESERRASTTEGDKAEDDGGPNAEGDTDAESKDG